MKRLTWQNYDMCQFCGEGACCEHYCDNTFPVCDDKAIYDRLAAIEEILGDEYELDRLRELVEADRKRRCVVLPCKKGDTVWRIVHDATPHITKDRCTNIKVENGEVWVSLIGDRVMGGWNFGKLLFLSEKETEAALKAREQE